MKWAAVLVLAITLWFETAAAQSVVHLTAGDPVGSRPIPSDFAGLSFETMLELPDGHGQHIFSRTNKPLIKVFKALGIHNLRLGGNTADLPNVAIPGTNDIDNLFAFAKAADVKVIYTLRLRNGDIANDAAVAGYIKKNYNSSLSGFAIGNEPDYYRKVYPKIKTYPQYIAEWRKFATAIAATVPGIQFCDPCTGGLPGWTRNFINDTAKSGLLAFATQHDYPAGGARHVTNAPAAIDKILSPALLEHYQKFYDDFGTTAVSNGVGFRLEETSNISDGGVTNASDTFAAALWSLDYLHWWAAHGASGVNLHGRRWVPNCVIHPAPGGHFGVRPIGYGVKAFDLGGHGIPVSLAISNADQLNLTAYAVRDGRRLYLTVINKEHGFSGRAANLIVDDLELGKKPSAQFLLPADGDVAAKAGITLGGETITDDGSWHGKWKTVTGTVTLPPASAVVIEY